MKTSPTLSPNWAICGAAAAKSAPSFCGDIPISIVASSSDRSSAALVESPMVLVMNWRFWANVPESTPTFSKVAAVVVSDDAMLSLKFVKSEKPACNAAADAPASAILIPSALLLWPTSPIIWLYLPPAPVALLNDVTDESKAFATITEDSNTLSNTLPNKFETVKVSFICRANSFWASALLVMASSCEVMLPTKVSEYFTWSPIMAPRLVASCPPLASCSLCFSWVVEIFSCLSKASPSFFNISLYSSEPFTASPSWFSRDLIIASW